MTDWADGLTTIALRWRVGNLSIRDLFRAAAPPNELTADEFRAVVAGHLRARPDLAEAWQTYSYDKRGTPSPYLDGLEVGFFD